MPRKISPNRAREYYERTKMNKDIAEEHIEKIGNKVNKHMTFKPTINKDKRSLSARRLYDRPWAVKSYKNHLFSHLGDSMST